MGFSDIDKDNNPVSFQKTCESTRSTHRAKLQQKEDELRQAFIVRVKNTEAELKKDEKQVFLDFIILQK